MSELVPMKPDNFELTANICPFCESEYDSERRCDCDFEEEDEELTLKANL